MTNETILQFKNVGKSFGETKAVQDISLEVRDGEILTLLGPSGCGKTTTLRMVAGLERCTTGEITYDGNVVDSAAEGKFIPTNKRGMGMVFQSYAIWPHMTIFENVAFPLRVRREKKKVIQENVHKILELTGLSTMAQRRSTQLSGGQQQRVALARALVYNPNILLLDEPFSNLDAKLREQMRVEVKLLQRKLGITVLFVTHDQTEALALSDRIVVINNGSIEQIGVPQELYENPQTPFVRDFLGRTITFDAEVKEIGSAGDVTVQVEQSEQNVHHTTHHFLKDPQAGQACYLVTRPERVIVQAAEQGELEAGALILKGNIRTLLFLGDQYEAIITLESGKVLTLYLPSTTRWHEKQDVLLQLPKEITVWPE